jgi:hypothetical protein
MQRIQVHIITALDYAIANKLTPFISMQNHYSLIYREEEREMFPTLKVWLRFIDHRKWSLIFLADVWRWLHSVVTSCAGHPDQTYQGANKTW